jgi:2-polyprenyl-3-methyl-5-hydroxy-6-metoxy-1,4-benzoquinol methylase
MSASAAVETRARLSRGRSDERIYRTVAALLPQRGTAGGVVADVGCGSAGLWPFLRGAFTSCIGLDAVRYDGLPADVDFRQLDLDRGTLPLPAGTVDAAVAVEVIEHLENPRAFVRELARIVRPGGWVVVTTPNQLSVLSLLSLVGKGQFAAFQATDYPAHRTALLETDLRRIFAECGLRDVQVAFTCYGRVPFTARHYPAALAHLAPRRFSDNIAIAGCR